MPLYHRLNMFQLGRLRCLVVFLLIIRTKVKRESFDWSLPQALDQSVTVSQFLIYDRQLSFVPYKPVEQQRVHDNNHYLPAAEWQILSMTTRGHFCLAFWWRVLHATTTTSLLELTWTFCPCVFNVSRKATGQRGEQLSYRTAQTIVCTTVCMHVRGPLAPVCKLSIVAGNICSVLCPDLGKFGIPNSLKQAWLTFIKPGIPVIHVLDMWARWVFV